MIRQRERTRKPVTLTYSFSLTSYLQSYYNYSKLINSYVIDVLLRLMEFLLLSEFYHFLLTACSVLPLMQSLLLALLSFLILMTTPQMATPTATLSNRMRRTTKKMSTVCVVDSSSAALSQLQLVAVDDTEEERSWTAVREK